jgi:diguanylate cyclase (GGDEF)-like protein/PAS domain S-box-containing protein
MLPDYQRKRRIIVKSIEPEQPPRLASHPGDNESIRKLNIRSGPAMQKQLQAMFHQCFALRRTEIALRESTSPFPSLPTHSPDGLIIWNQDGELVEVNQAACDALGYTRNEMLALRLADIDGKVRHATQNLLKTLSPQSEVVVRRSLRHRDGSLLMVEMRIGVMRRSGSWHQFAQLRNISAARRIAARLQYLARHDTLTGLLNRKAFVRRMRDALRLAQGNGSRLALLMLDIDRFHHWNEALGHETCDGLLKQVAKRLRAVLPQGTVIARTSGNEFAVLLANSACDQAMMITRALLAALNENFGMHGRSLRLSARIGIAAYPEHGSNHSALLQHALAAMRGARVTARERLCHEAPVHAPCAPFHPRLESALRDAVQRGQLELHYQAKVDARSNRISGCEALLRWRHPEHGLMLPERFIPMAEETGLIVPLTRWVLHEACRQMQRWHAAALTPGHVAVNLSAGPFIETGLLQDVRQALTESGMNPSLLELEITESMMMQDTENARATLAGLKQLGVRIAIDDFGIGHSSLSQLKNLPIDIIKIDRSFIIDLPGDRVDEAIAGAIIALGKSLQAAVVAEGVEAEEQLDFLRALGCDHIQGYYFSKPAPAAEFEALLRQEARGTDTR